MVNLSCFSRCGMQIKMDVVTIPQQKIILTFTIQLSISRAHRRLIHLLNPHQRFLNLESALKNAQVVMKKLPYNVINHDIWLSKPNPTRIVYFSLDMKLIYKVN
jgi:hypothetical protein